MPFPNESSSRLENPSKYQKFKRTKGGIIYGSKKVPQTISIIWGHTKGEPKDAWHPQTLRFPISDWTPTEAQKWLKDNNINNISFEPASNKQKFEKDMFKKIPVYRINPIEREDYQMEMSIVNDPAIEEHALLFNDEVKEEIINFSDEQQIIYGPAMIPNKLIYRKQRGNIPERFVTYDEEGIKQCVSMFFKNGIKFNSEHSDKKVPVEFLESYFAKEDNEFNVPKNSWILKVKVTDNEYWKQIKEQKQGFSIESIFSDELIGTEVLNFKNEEPKKMSIKEKLLEAINLIVFDEEKVEKVEDKVEEVVIEEMAIQQPVDTQSNDVQPSGDTVSPKYLTEEEVSFMIDEAKQEILDAVAQLLQGNQDQVTAMSAELEKFKNEPITKPVGSVKKDDEKLTPLQEFLASRK